MTPSSSCKWQVALALQMACAGDHVSTAQAHDVGSAFQLQAHDGYQPVVTLLRCPPLTPLTWSDPIKVSAQICIAEQVVVMMSALL